MTPQDVIDILGQMMGLFVGDLGDLSREHLANLEETLNQSNQTLASERVQLVEALSGVIFDFDHRFNDSVNAMVAGMQKATKLPTTDTRGQGEQGDKGGNLIAAAMKKELSVLIGVFTPLATFATILNQSTSGLQLFLGAVNMMASTLAPLLMPFFFLLTVALIALSATIWDKLQPALVSFYTYILETGLPVVQKFIESLENGYRRLVKLVQDPKGELGKTGKEIGENAANEGPPFIQRILKWFGVEGEDDKIRRALANENNEGLPQGFMGGGAGGAGEFGGEDEKKKADEDTREKIRNAADMAIRQFEMTQGSKASLTGIVQASRQAQVAAVGMTPFESEQLRRQQEQIQVMRQVLAAILGKGPGAEGALALVV